jgi:hypothetical protein
MMTRRSLNETIPHMAPVVVLPQSENVLLNRYSNYAHVRTDAVFLTDDDITLCAEVRSFIRDGGFRVRQGEFTSDGRDSWSDRGGFLARISTRLDELEKCSSYVT